MDFAWSEEQAAFRKEVLRFAREELKDDVIARDRNEEFSKTLWKKCADFGIQGLPIPTEYGGGGADTLTTVCALEALGYGCADNGLLFSINAHMWSSEIPIWNFGTEAQKKKYLPGLVSGGLGLHAMTEPGSGSDAYSLKTRAERKGDKYVLNGSKTFSSNAPDADVTIVFANLDPDPRPERGNGVPGRQGDDRVSRSGKSFTRWDCGLRRWRNSRCRIARFRSRICWARNLADRRSSHRRWSGSGFAFWPAISVRCSASWKPASSMPKSASNLASRLESFRPSTTRLPTWMCGLRPGVWRCTRQRG